MHPINRDHTEAASLEERRDARECEASDDASNRPPLPPRPSITPSDVSPCTPRPGRPGLPARPTTAVSSVDIQTLSFPDGSKGTFSTAAGQSALDNIRDFSGASTPNRKASRTAGDVDDAASVVSYTPTLRANADLSSLLDEGLGVESPAWKSLALQVEASNPFQTPVDKQSSLIDFEQEFHETSVSERRGSGEDVVSWWKNKYKHYMILSSAGKPIYSRHGDLNLVNGYIGIIQTIISAFENSEDSLRGFTAGNTRFVVLINGPLYFVAISNLGESDMQLRAQLEALYMQILSTLTLPTLNHLFSKRPNTDLRRPLEGTEVLLSSLVDQFTKGSPSTLLSALECLKMRKSHRHVIDNTLLKARTDKLLYGLIVAGGRLVSVVRPKRHSLHPSDLQLIFNMLFEAGSVKTGGGENWIPVCLPGFNNQGYLYMYVSFLDVSQEDVQQAHGARGTRDDEIAIILISADKEGFFNLREMRDDVVGQLGRNGSIRNIRAAICEGRPNIDAIAPSTVIKHFIYKSRPNVQLAMSTFSPLFDTLLPRRRLMTAYHTLHASLHAKHSHLKLLHTAFSDHVSFAWSTQTFEFYAIAGPNASRASLAQGAKLIVQWIRKQEERLFIIGGAVF